MNFLGLLVCHPELRNVEQLKMSTRLYFPKIFALISKNRHYIFRRQEGGRCLEPTESMATAVEESLKTFKEYVEPHQIVASLLKEDCTLNQYLSEIDEIPGFLELMALMLLVVRVDLKDFDDHRWCEGGHKNLFENFLDSLKLQYCRLRKPSNQKLFMEKVEAAVIDKISSIGHLKRKHYSSGLVSYVQV